MDAPVTTPTSAPEGAPVAQGDPGAPPLSPPTTGPSFFARLPDDLKALPALQKFEKADDATFAKSYVELEKVIGQKQGIKPLTAESTPEDITAYRQAMGVPEKPDGYELGELNFPEGAKPTEAQMAAFKTVAHEFHLTPAQLQGVLSWHSGDISRQWNALQEGIRDQSKADDEALRKIHGGEYPRYRIMGKNYIERKFGKDAIDELNFERTDPLRPGPSIAVIEMAAELERQEKGHEYIAGDGQGGLMDQQVAKNKIADLYGQLAQARREGKDSEAESFKREIERLGPIAG